MSTRPKRSDEKREPLPSKVRPDLRQIVETLATEAESTVSNTVERLLLESPRVKKKLRLRTAAALSP